MFFKKPVTEQTDADLLKAFRKTENSEVLSELYSRYMHLVYGVCLKYLQDREESKDAVMQIYEKLTQELIRHEVENFKSWLHVLTRNHCLMILRAQKTQLNRIEGLKKDAVFFMENSYELHHDNGQAVDRDIKALKMCIERLNEEQKVCISQFYLEEKCYQEISKNLGYDLKKVKSYIQNGKRNLKICLEKNNVKSE